MKKEKQEEIISKLQGKKQCYLCNRWFDLKEVEYFEEMYEEGSYFGGGWVCYDCQAKAEEDARAGDEARAEAEAEAMAEAEARIREEEDAMAEAEAMAIAQAEAEREAMNHNRF